MTKDERNAADGCFSATCQWLIPCVDSQIKPAAPDDALPVLGLKYSVLCSLRKNALYMDGFPSGNQGLG
jgi:hypothetical protein